jgi:hypothetical protein
MPSTKKLRSTPKSPLFKQLIVFIWNECFPPCKKIISIPIPLDRNLIRGRMFQREKHLVSSFAIWKHLSFK